MLAVIEHEERVPRFERLDEVRERIALGRQRESECLRNRRRNVIAAREWSEFDKPDAVARTIEEICSNL